MADTVAILLAAGESRRMGQLKALLPWQGFSLLMYQVAALKDAGVDRVVVVLGHQAEQLRPILEGREGVTLVLNPDYLQGKTTSIKAGLKTLASSKPAVLVILNVDQPRRPETIRYLLQQHWDGPALITIPTHQGKGGHPIVLAPSLLDELLGINEETQGIKAVVQRHKADTLRVEMESPEVLWDLNTPEQYGQALRD
jgi:molybdenum cofactor cytidylyltransferase